MINLRKLSLSGTGTKPEDCIFCKIVSRKAPSNIVYEDDDYIAFLDAFPFSPGHTLVCPKSHGETIWDMEEGEIGELFRMASKVSRGIVEAVDADGFRFVQNNGEAANQVVAHVHVHVIPVKMMDKGRFVERRKYSESEMHEIAEKIRKALSSP